MKIVVTGGTGFIGRKLVARLAEKVRAVEGDVVVVSRSEPSQAPPANVSFVTWSRDGGDAWRDAVAKADAVVNLAGAGVMDARWTDARKEEITSSRVTPTSEIAAVLSRADAPRDRPRVFVSASAIGIYGFENRPTAIDEAGSLGDDFLARVCKRWEAAAEVAKTANVRVVHPRIGIVLGRDGGALAKMVPPFKAFAGGPIGKGDQGMSWVHERDVIRALEFAIESTTLEGPFNLTAPNPATMDEFAHTIGDVLHRPSVMRAPAFALKVALGESASVLLQGPRVRPAKLLAADFRFEFEQLRPALEQILLEAA